MRTGDRPERTLSTPGSDMRRVERLRTAVAVVSAILALGASTARPASAQLPLGSEGEWSIFISPRVGFLQPGNAGPLEGWVPEGLRIVGGPVAGVAIELRTPVPWFALRATMERSARNNLSFGNFGSGEVWDPFTDPLFLSRASALQTQYSVGGVLRPLSSPPIRPIGVVGFGLRNWEWDPAALPSSLVPRFPETRWDRAWHWGVGVEADAEPLSLRVEVLDYRTRAEADAGRRVGVTDRFVMLTLRWTGYR